MSILYKNITFVWYTEFSEDKFSQGKSKCKKET